MDLDPSSVTTGGWLEDTSLVETYNISDKDTMLNELVSFLLPRVGVSEETSYVDMLFVFTYQTVLGS